MHRLFVIGTSSSVAELETRERLYVDLPEIRAATQGLIASGDVLDEALPLATCGRQELYGVAPDPERAVRLLLRGLAARTGVEGAELRESLFLLRGRTAVRHLLRVAAGLDSVVHGEAQILGQVRDAAHDPDADTTKGPVLHRLFETALATGKRVRTETEIGRGAASLAGAALCLVEGEMGPLETRSALVIGAGETGELVARLLRKQGVGKLTVVNRTPATARAVAERLGGQGAPLDELDTHLAEADIVVGAATSDHFLVTAEQVRRAGTPRVFLDLAHPRSIAPEVGGLDDVQLLDLDRVFDEVQQARESRLAQIPRAEEIVKEQAEAFAGWVVSRETVPVLRAVRSRFLEVAAAEAQRLGRGRSEEERELVARLARSMARTLLHEPTVALREADPASPEGRLILDAAPALFGVRSPPSADAQSADERLPEEVG